MKIRRFGMAVLVLVMLSPAPARAEGLFKLFLGTSNDDDRNSATYGLGLGALAGGIFGFEVDFGISPDFLGAGVEDSNLVTIMGNLVLAVPLGVVRPYASSGVGLLRFSVAPPSDLLDIDSNDFGVNMGGGVEGFLTNNIGVIGDIRYFRSIEKGSALLDSFLGSFNFWRLTAGVTFAF